MKETRDKDLRAHLKKVLHPKEPYRIVDELAIRGSVADVIRITSKAITGYEIKSDRDTLKLLPGQIKAYSKIFDYCYLVTTPKYAYLGRRMIPDWWGMIVIKYDHKGHLRVQKFQPSAKNYKQDLNLVMKLIWKEELLDFLRDRDLLRGRSQFTKEKLSKFIITRFGEYKAKRFAMRTLMYRKDWKG